MKVEKYNPTEAEVAAYSSQNPFSIIHEMNEFIDSMRSHFWSDPAFLTTRNWRPSDLHEDKDNLYLEVELPRFKRDEVKVEAKNRAVLVTAKNNRSSFNRIFSFPGVDYDKIDAKLENGLLTVTFPKTPEAKAKIIELK